VIGNLENILALARLAPSKTYKFLKKYFGFPVPLVGTRGFTRVPPALSVAGNKQALPEEGTEPASSEHGGHSGHAVLGVCGGNLQALST